MSSLARHRATVIPCFRYRMRQRQRLAVLDFGFDPWTVDEAVQPPRYVGAPGCIGGAADQGAQASHEEDAMKFLFLIYHDETVMDALPEGEMQTLIDSALDYDEEIRQSGHYIVSNALQSARTARTIRVRGGKVAITDGPFAETKEHLGGFFLVEAKDMDEACEVASRFPPARLGTIEVRPVQELKHS